MLLLHLSGPGPLTSDQLKTWRSAFDESVAFDALSELSSTELDPLQMTLVLDGAYEPNDVASGIVAAFASIDITTGLVAIALSEHEPDDHELETPPFYECELDLARGVPLEPALAHVRLEILQAEPYTPAQLEVLERALRAHMGWPVEQLTPVSPSLNGRYFARLELVPMQLEELPDRAELKANALKALAAAHLKPLRLKLGAYVGTWDNTLYDDTL